jgi:hypothetical protein
VTDFRLIKQTTDRTASTQLLRDLPTSRQGPRDNVARILRLDSVFCHSTISVTTISAALKKRIDI